MIKKVIWIVAMLGVMGAVTLGWAYSGQYDVAADAVSYTHLTLPTNREV